MFDDLTPMNDSGDDPFEVVMSSGDEIGRVLRASTTGFAVGCRVNQLSGPSFGCLVKAQPMDSDEAVFGLVYNMHIDDDPLVRRLILAENPRQSVIEDQRNNRLLPIEMSVLIVGYERENELRHGLPPRPPLNLDPVFLCLEQDEVIRFTENPAYLRLILRAVDTPVPVDQLLVAHVQQAYSHRGNDVSWVLRVVRTLIDLLRGDYELLLPALEAIGEAIPELPAAAHLEPDFR